MLKQQQGYVLSKIGPHTYLLPYGQSIADQKHGIIINETGDIPAWENPPTLPSGINISRLPI